MDKNFDAIIIGAGQAGPALAERLTKAGMTVALIERHLVGGTCVNNGCKPTKTMVASAYAAHMARRGADFGVGITGDITIDMRRVHERAKTVTLDSRASLDAWIGAMSGCTYIRGHARLTGPHGVEVDGQTLTAPKIFLNVGGRAVVPPMPGIDSVPYLTNVEMMELTEIPRHLVVIGGSYIGLEFAQMFRRFGAEVTVIERGDRLIAREDEDISSTVKTILEGEGIAFELGATDVRFERQGDDIGIDVGNGKRRIVCSHVLVAVGRIPNTEDLGLAAAGVETDPRGYIKVDDSLATTADGIWALGDCNGRGAFTHTAYNDFEIVAANLLDGEQRRLSDRILGYALFIDPPLGRVGMSETEARKSGRKILVGMRQMTRVGRAVEKGEPLGFMKIVADAETHQILGAAILGTSGDEAIHGILNAINAEVPYNSLQWAVPIHPTVSELIPTLIGSMAPVA